jgi:hypothetical protein
MVEESLAIADDSGKDWIEYETVAGRIRREPNSENIQRSRLRVDYRKWLIEKWSPKQYGATSRLELTGADGGPILLQQITLVAMRELEAERLDESSKPSGLDEAERLELEVVDTQTKLPAHRDDGAQNGEFPQNARPHDTT